MAANINRVVLVGNLTRDPELRHTPSGTPVCSLRVAVNTRRKDESGEWVDKPNYFDVTVWGKQGENCAQYLSKGRPVAVDGRLEWREWEAQDGSGKRQAVEIVADSVQFLGGRDDAGGGNGFAAKGDGLGRRRGGGRLGFGRPRRLGPQRRRWRSPGVELDDPEADDAVGQPERALEALEQGRRGVELVQVVLGVALVADLVGQRADA